MKYISLLIITALLIAGCFKAEEPENIKLSTKEFEEQYGIRVSMKDTEDPLTAKGLSREKLNEKIEDVLDIYDYKPVKVGHYGKNGQYTVFVAVERTEDPLPKQLTEVFAIEHKYAKMDTYIVDVLAPEIENSFRFISTRENLDKFASHGITGPEFFENLKVEKFSQK